MFDLGQWLSTLFGPLDVFLKKYPMDHYAMLTPHEQLDEIVMHIGDLTYIIAQ